MVFETLLTFTVLVNAIATVTLWQEAVRRPEKVRKRFLKSLLNDGPITPKHQPPPPLEKISTSGWGIYGHEETLPQFFDDYKDFAATVNRNLGSEYPPGDEFNTPWRLQELPDALLKLDYGDDSPGYGRRYEVFHNQMRLGELEISGYLYPNVTARIRLDWLRLLSYHDLRSFLGAISSCIFDRTAEKEFTGIQRAIDQAMTEALWDTYQISDAGLESADYGNLDCRLDGPSARTKDRRHILRPIKEARVPTMKYPTTRDF
jgi:hypothetical protein